MDKARILVDFNARITSDIVVLSRDDTKTDSEGNLITFYEGMPVSIYSDDLSDDGEIDNLVAEGIAMKRDVSNLPKTGQYAKWCCYIDSNGILHESDLRE